MDPNPNPNPNLNTKKDEAESETSPTELFSSAQVLAGAAKSSFSNESDKVDKAKAASAADELLHGASKYGKLEDTSYEPYVEKAEGYLHQYSDPSKTEKVVKPTEQDKATPPPPEKETAPPPEKEEESSGGFGGVMKMAKGFLK